MSDVEDYVNRRQLYRSLNITSNTIPKTNHHLSSVELIKSQLEDTISDEFEDQFAEFKDNSSVKSTSKHSSIAI